jgi:hypothetical protein
MGGPPPDEVIIALIWVVRGRYTLTGTGPRKAMSSGYQAHVSKPVETDHFLGVVAALVAAR